VANQASDSELIAKARKGHTGALRLLVERYQQRVFAVALGLVHNREDALDISQEAFLRVHRSLDSFEGDSQFFTWLYRIVYNLCIDHLRRRRFETVALDDIAEPIQEEEPLDADPLRKLDNEQLRERLNTALAALTPAHRAVLILREVEGLSYKEIAAVVGCTMGTVMSRLFHARKNLQRQLGSAEEVTLALAA
jgi:RNA polymerase sigma-70 factor (ECF subfamily)